MENNKIVIFVEHVNRELDSAVLLKILLEKKGYRVYISSTLFGTPDISYITPKMILIPWCYDNSDITFYLSKFYRVNRGNIPTIINLHHEQITYESGQNFQLPVGQAKDIFHIAWGEEFVKKLKRCGVPEHLIFKTGSPRLDFYKTELSQFSKTKIELSKNFDIPLNRKWILFAGNFSVKDFDEKLLCTLESRGLKKIRKSKIDSQNAFNSITTWIKLFLDKNGEDIEFIYRPHPSENYENSELKNLEKRSNFHIIKKYSLRDWILNVDVVNVWTSTSAVEALIAKKTVNIVRPFPIDDELEMPIFKNTKLIDDFQSFVNANNSPENITDKQLMANVEVFFDNTNNKLASEKLVEIIDEIVKSETNAKIAFTKTKHRWHHFFTSSYRLLRNFLYRINLLPNYSLTYKNNILTRITYPFTFSNDFFSKKEIKSLENRLNDILK
jgi:surface carbohydrate biosynthesis protein